MAEASFQGEDCMLWQKYPTTNFDGGRDSGGGVWHSEWGMILKGDEAVPLMRIDFSGTIGAGDTITAATFGHQIINVNGDPNKPNTVDWYIFPCLRNDAGSDPWVVDEATWNKYDASNNWGTAGCKGADTDYRTDAGSRDTFTGPGSTGWFEIDVLNSVQYCQANNNRIWDVVCWAYHFLTEADDFMYWQFYTYKFVNPEYRPTLTIEYTPAEPPPGGSRNRGYVFGSRLGLPSLPDGWLRRRGLLVPA